MDNNKKVLDGICKRSREGLRTVDTLDKMDISPEIREELGSMREEYRRFADAAAEIMSGRGYCACNQSTFSEIGSEVTLNLKTMHDRSNTKIAELLMKASADGVIEGTKLLRQSDSADDEVKRLADTFIEREKNNFCSLRNFL